MSFGMYPGLSNGAYRAIHHHGSPGQKRTFLPRLVDGTWSGTMCLTEPQCGTDLGQIRTRAEPTGKDGVYKITGTKIFISAGEHDLTDNIIHLVLARITGGARGHPRHQPVHRAEIPGQGGWRRRREQRRALRLDRAQDGNQGVVDLRHQLR